MIKCTLHVINWSNLASFWSGLYSEGRIHGEIFAFPNWLGYVFEDNFPSASSRGLYLEGRFDGGSFASPLWGLMHGGAYFRYFTVWVNSQSESLFKVAEHSFQVPMPNSPLLLNHLCFGAHFLQEWRLTTEVFNLAFLQGCVLLTWRRAWLKTRLKKWFLLF